MPATWLVRADTGGRLAPEFKSKSLVAIGWVEAGNTLELNTREAFFQRMKDTYPEDSKPKQHNSAGQVFRFVREVQVGDQVVTYDNARRLYLVGKITSPAKFDAALFDGEFSTYRQVEWRHEVSRDALTIKAKNSLGSVLTLFKVPVETVQEFEALIGGLTPQQSDDEADALEEKDLLQDLQSKSIEFIKDRVSRLDWEQMQHLTAGLLRAMGYKTRISPSGPDRGKDVVASPDGFGFEQPRIIIEVKHRRGQMGTQEVRGFLAVIRHPGDKGLYVSTGGFSREAYYEAERANHPITLMDLDGLVEAIMEHYEAMDLETRVLLPLKKIYWPT
jgi:restriction system protein